MKLSDFPRPPDDTRIGIHWSPGVADAIGIGPIRDYWIPLLKEMGIKWVKLLHRGSFKVAEELLANGIMPIVRLYRRAPNSTNPSPGEGTLGQEEIAALETLVSIGVRYFEFNNEPDSGFEWRTPMPPDEAEAQRIVARNAIRDMETILNKGGLPGIPAVSVGKRWDLLGAIIAEGGADLIPEGVWWAIHNYDINHPVDYPYDAVNQDGALLTREEYEALGQEAWTGPHWGTRSLDFINEHRRTGANPGHTGFDDPTCFRGYEYFAHLSLQHLGYHIPLLSTENGPVVGEDNDPRYPTTTPEIHRDKVLEMCRIMMGTSQQFDPAPDYYFCTAFWILGNRVLGSLSSNWEPQAWFSERWNGGKLPVVDALRALPKRVWQPRGGVTEPPAEGGSRVYGVVRGGANRHIVLRSTTYNAEAVVSNDETYAFEGVPAGTYRVAVLGTEAVRLGVEVDGVHAVEVNFDLREEAPPAWTYTVEDAGPGPGFGVIRCRVQGMTDLAVRLWAEGWSGDVRRTGTKPEYGPDVCEFAPLNPGTYFLEPDGLGVRATVPMEANRVVWVTFRQVEQPVPEPAPANSILEGLVENGAGREVRLTGPVERRETVGEDERFRFEGLPAGTYALEVVGTDVRREGIALDGTNRVEVRLKVPVPRQSTVRGSVFDGAGQRVQLIGPEGTLETTVAEDETFAFTGLPPGVYTVRLPDVGVEQGDIHLDGMNTVELRLTVPPQETGWVFTVEDGGTGPGFGVVRCEVRGRVDHPVRLWTRGWEGLVRRTGSKPEYGPYACEFAPLGSGTYFIEPEGLGVRAQVLVDGQRVVWVRFHPAREEEPAQLAKIYDLYLWPGRMPRSREEFEAVLTYTAHFKPEVGTSLEAARRARHVLVLGAGFPARDEEVLSAAGTSVHRVEGDWSEVLSDLVARGQPLP